MKTSGCPHDEAGIEALSGDFNARERDQLLQMRAEGRCPVCRYAEPAIVREYYQRLGFGDRTEAEDLDGRPHIIGDPPGAHGLSDDQLYRRRRARQHALEPARRRAEAERAGVAVCGQRSPLGGVLPCERQAGHEGPHEGGPTGVYRRAEDGLVELLKAQVEAGQPDQPEPTELPPTTQGQVGPWTKLYGDYVLRPTRNKLEVWVKATPGPFHGLRKRCECGRKFWTVEGYRAHYALAHVLFYGLGEAE